MTAVLIDANVLLDVITEDPRWLAWSAEALERASERYRLVINPVIYAEVSIRYSRIEALDAALPKASFDREAIPYEAAFLAGKAFLRLSPTGWDKAIAAARFLHRRARCRCGISADDARRDALPKLFPQIVADRPDLSPVSKTTLTASRKSPAPCLKAPREWRPARRRRRRRSGSRCRAQARRRRCPSPAICGRWPRRG